nr:MAG TPA: hypothetical protein [Caudoviricetes sp.]
MNISSRLDFNVINEFTIRINVQTLVWGNRL